METIDTQIEALRTTLYTSALFSSSYARTFKFREKNADNSIKISPSIVIEGNELKIIRPNDQDRGILFFYVKDKSSSLDFVSGSDSNWYNFQVDVICWFNSTLHQDWKGLESSLHAIKKLISKESKFQIKSIFYEAESIFEGFTLDEVEKQYFCHPYYGCKISGTFDILENNCSDL